MCDGGAVRRKSDVRTKLGWEEEGGWQEQADACFLNGVQRVR